jgi:hypothetical protein
MILWGNAVNVNVPGGGVLDLTWSDAGGAVSFPAPPEGVWPGTGNIDVDPTFADPAHRAFGLSTASPCRGAGRDGTDMGAASPGPGGRTFIRGDATDDAVLNITDAIVILGYLFASGDQPACLDAADADDNGVINLTDPVYLLDHLFRGGPPLAAPYPDPGRDPSEDEIDCGG